MRFNHKSSCYICSSEVWATTKDRAKPQWTGVAWHELATTPPHRNSVWTIVLQCYVHGNNTAHNSATYTLSLEKKVNLQLFVVQGSRCLLLHTTRWTCGYRCIQGGHRVWTTLIGWQRWRPKVTTVLFWWWRLMCGRKSDNCCDCREKEILGQNFKL